jgi:protein-L-isoaspartate(D-aspartate) O-methyltransferase
MFGKYSAARKKWIETSIILLILVSLPAVTFVGSCDKKRDQVAAVQNEPADTNQTTVDPNDKNNPAFSERLEERKKMVAMQIAVRGINDANVLEAMRKVPRHAFMPAAQQRYAYVDSALPIEHGQTISQPYIVAFMTEALQLDPNSKVLEIGTGSGYQAAVCADVAREVYTIEIVEELAASAAKVLKELGYDNIHVRAGDGYFGWPEHAPFDAIIGTAAAGHVPKPLLEQLKPGGRMILPVEGQFGFQHLILITKDENGNLQQKNVMPVRFVPMTGEVQKPEKKNED